ncbi:olfactory receptor 5V1-like [Chiroxiphia lanceolata]|uniref:olfactory receptor 5V1-like n=1 Tax=Chiroxiphia lanceolata TaxID=296741 RepID=UPI0013CEE022|nr:olfactory receptor 5V1-like [Chiroxiphia lanceolata]
MNTLEELLFGLLCREKMSQRKDLENHTVGSGFVLLAFCDHSNLQGLCFPVFLLIYLVVLAGNSLLALLTVLDSSLHNPTCFFLRNLSFLQVCYTSVTLPKMLVCLLRADGRIFPGCAAQLYFLVLLGSTQSLLLAAVAYERCMTLCHPLPCALSTFSAPKEFSVKSSFKLDLTNNTTTISYSGCIAQVFLLVFFLGAEFSLLTVMCYDRYVAICKPLHYGTLLGSRACAHMAAAAWAAAFLTALLHTANTFSLPLCQGNALGQFFCEIPHVLKLSCSHSGYLREIGLLGVSGCFYFDCFVFIVFSYVQIFRAVLRIPSQQGRHKAFSTCLPHLAVVSLFISTSFFAYLKPPSISSPSLDLTVSVLYSVVPPALNPLIYSLRNQELKDALRKLITVFFRSNKLSFFCMLCLVYDLRSS